MPSRRYTDETNCGHCETSHCVFEIPECQHTFHFRCVAQWPLVACPICRISTAGVELLSRRKFDASKNKLRNGKWTLEEEKFVETLIDEFLQGRVFCANGTSVRLVLARVLNCSPMRLSKKFQRNALGKHTFRLPDSRKIDAQVPSHHQHATRLSELEQAFHATILKSKKPGAIQMHQNLIHASTEFWEKQFLGFARFLAQSVVDFDFHVVPKRRKRRRQVTVSTLTTQPWIRNTKKEDKLDDFFFNPDLLLPIELNGEHDDIQLDFLLPNPCTSPVTSEESSEDEPEKRTKYFHSWGTCTDDIDIESTMHDDIQQWMISF